MLVRMWRKWNFKHCSGNVNGAATLETSLIFSYNVKRKCTTWQRVQFKRIWNEMRNKRYVPTKPRIQMIIAVEVIVAKMCKQSKCPLTCDVLSLCHVQLFVASWTIAHQALLSIGFSRQKHWNGLPFPCTYKLWYIHMN